MYKPGDIVRLKTPYKPLEPERALIDAVAPVHTPQRAWYDLWPGFTHGIIAQIIDEEHSGVVAVSLHLYDPARRLIFVEEHNHGIPTYVDFSSDELDLLKDGATLGYTVISQE